MRTLTRKIILQDRYKNFEKHDIKIKENTIHNININWRKNQLG